MSNKKCPFCNIDEKLLIEETKYSTIMVNLMQIASVDALLVTPKRHVKTIGELSEVEYIDFCEAIKYVHNRLSKNGWNKFNILINEGLLAGQTVPHLHAHIFSREEKDGIKNMLRKNRKNIFTDWNEKKTDLFLQRINTIFEKS